jgi:hypothetical protein
MRSTVFLVAAGLCAIAGAAQADTGHPAAPAGGTQYDVLLADLKGGHTEIDYAAFRVAYANSAHYDPYGEPSGRDAMLAASKAHDCGALLDAATRVLNDDFTDIEAHVLSAHCAEERGDTSSAKFHHDVAAGLIRSIARSGDGTSAGSPYVVMAVKEEYAFLYSQGYRVTMQALVKCGTGECDAMSVEDHDGKKATFFFDVSRPMVWLTKQFGAKGSK